MEKTHYKRLMNPDYIGAYELLKGDESTDMVVTILNVSREMVKGTGGKSEELSVAKLRNQKPMILNSTNSKMIAKIAGSPYIEDWANLRITLYVAYISAFGEKNVECLRIRKQKPELPELTPDHERWPGAKEAISKGSVTIDEIKNNYKLSAKHEKLLK